MIYGPKPVIQHCVNCRKPVSIGTVEYISGKTIKCSHCNDILDIRKTPEIKHLDGLREIIKKGIPKN